MEATMSDLEALIPQSVELIIDGEALAIKPLKVGQMPAFLRAISPVMQQLTASEIDWLALFGERGDDLAADEAILLAAKVIEVNADFFARTVIPKLDGLFTAANVPPVLKAAAGTTLSST